MSKLAEKMLDTLTQVYWMTGEHDAAIAIIDAALEERYHAGKADGRREGIETTIGRCIERWSPGVCYSDATAKEWFLGTETCLLEEEPYIDPLDGTRRVDATGVQK